MAPRSKAPVMSSDNAAGNALHFINIVPDSPSPSPEPYIIKAESISPFKFQADENIPPATTNGRSTSIVNISSDDKNDLASTALAGSSGASTSKNAIVVGDDNEPSEASHRVADTPIAKSGSNENIHIKTEVAEQDLASVPPQKVTQVSPPKAVTKRRPPKLNLERAAFLAKASANWVPVGPTVEKRSAGGIPIIDIADDTDSDLDIGPAPAPKSRSRKEAPVSRVTAGGAKKQKLKSTGFQLPATYLDHFKASLDDRRSATPDEITTAPYIKTEDDSVADISTLTKSSDDTNMTDDSDAAANDDTTLTHPDEEPLSGGITYTKDEESEVDSESHHIDQSNVLILSQPTNKRADRIVDENDPADQALIAAAIAAGKKVGRDIYDSDEETKGEVTSIAKNKAHLFRNVRWGDGAYLHNDDDWEETKDFTQFVPGRWERLPDGSLRDQKAKCVLFITNTATGDRKIFRNAPPKDWSSQPAITALNKRSVQQIRRNTNTRFRAVVSPYAEEERLWISKNLNKDGKPIKGWKRFQDDFNSEFEGKTLKEFPDEPRPGRTASSLTKEVERFSHYYKNGKVPVTIKDADKRKGKRKALKAARRARDAESSDASD